MVTVAKVQLLRRQAHEKSLDDIRAFLLLQSIRKKLSVADFATLKFLDES